MDIYSLHQLLNVNFFLLWGKFIVTGITAFGGSVFVILLVLICLMKGIKGRSKILKKHVYYSMSIIGLNQSTFSSWVTLIVNPWIHWRNGLWILTIFIARSLYIPLIWILFLLFWYDIGVYTKAKMQAMTYSLKRKCQRGFSAQRSLYILPTMCVKGHYIVQCCAILDEVKGHSIISIR